MLGVPDKVLVIQAKYINSLNKTHLIIINVALVQHQNSLLIFTNNPIPSSI
jgi:hypothetical protein